MSTGPRGSGPAIGAEFAGHRIEEVIGEGGMGVVYRALNLALDRVRALKVLAPALSADTRFRERFRRESRLAASIEHPNVIPIHEAGEQDGHLYLSMRLVEGSDLRQMIALEGALEAADAAGVIDAVAAGLDAAHAAGLIHRDVKPANVLVGGGPDAGRVYLTDFGISRTMRGGETVTGTGELVGTADFVAPEQIAGDPVDHRADVYALGAVLHFALTGESPFPRDNELATLFAHANAPRPRPSQVDPGLSPRLDPVVAKAMAIDPGERFESAGALARALDAVIEGEETVPLGESAGSPVAVSTASPRTGGRSRADGARAIPGGARRPSARAWAALGLLAAAAAAVAAVVILAGDDDPSPGEASPATAGAPIHVGRAPVGIAVGPERVWAASSHGDEVDAIDQVTSGVTFEVPVASPISVAVGFGSVWAVSKATDALYRLDPVEGAEPLEIPLGDGAEPADVAVDERWVWVANAGTQNVIRLDPDDNTLAGNVPLGTEPRAIATGDGAVWVTNIRAASVSRIDPDGPQRIGSSIPVGELPNDVAVGEGSVWVTSSLNGTVYEIDPERGEVVGDPIAVGDLPRGIRAGLGYVWVALGGEDAVVRIDPRSGELAGEPIAVGDDPADIALGTDSAWTANEGDSTVTRISP